MFQDLQNFISSPLPKFHRKFFKSDKEYSQFQAQCSLQSFIRRYGKEQGKLKFDEYKKLRAYLASEEYFIKKLGEKQGKIKYRQIQKRKAITRENLCKKYGQVNGDKRYASFLDKTLKNFVSKKSIDFLDTVSNVCDIDIRHGKNSSEKKIKCEKTMHPVDGYCKTLNCIFEFYGDKWHVNPELYSEKDTNIRNKIATKVWSHDKKRLNNMLPVVNAIFVCWEYDWKHNKDNVLNQVKELIQKLKKLQLSKNIYFLGETKCK